MDKNCATCGKSFSKKKNQSLKTWDTRVKYCSFACRKNGKIIKCPICKTETYFIKARLKLNSRFCSKKCFNKSKKGEIPSNLKYARSKSPFKKGMKPFIFQGEKHWNWKGENVGYAGVHDWLRKEHGNATKCENKNCVYPRKNARGKMMQKPKSFQWANISGECKRDRNNFCQLCASCHKLYDLKCGNIKL